MLTIDKTNCASSGELLDRCVDTVEFYGFDALDDIFKERKQTRSGKPTGNPTLVFPTERRLAATTKQLITYGFNRNSSPRFTYQVDTSSKNPALGLHAIGSRSAIAEGVLIATLGRVAQESGIKDYTVHINSIGDKESATRFVRELTSFLRAHINDLPAPARDDLQKGNPIRAYSRLVEKHDDLASSAPNPMEFLNDESRTHLRDVLEYAENMGVPYELDTSVLGSNDCWQHTMFELRVPTTDGGMETIAHGGRHNTLAQKSYRIDLPIVSAVIEHVPAGSVATLKRTPAQPRFFFAQLGPVAKMKSFTVLERLRDAGVPVKQQIALESIGSQLKHAEEYAVPYTVIMGHKEALENTVIVRDMHSRSQVVVPLQKLGTYLKRLKVA